MKSHMRGFTLIELIVVIVILAILAATALPKFVDVGGDARKAVIQSVEGSMRSANSIIYAKAAAANKLGASGAISVNAATVNVEFGFAATVSPDLVAVMDLSPAADFTQDGTSIQHAKATTAANCEVEYAKATAATTPPTYTTTLTGC
ncbi:MAG: prepilin-type N-terminal cleavage/methylation domain-containing protein [Betaproteobacteria bacterium]|nr:prepilin-type N-terminal cleavage/methylation domain-containing protein [Betaproteobacteria bacterium]